MLTFFGSFSLIFYLPTLLAQAPRICTASNILLLLFSNLSLFLLTQIYAYSDFSQLRLQYTTIFQTFLLSSLCLYDTSNCHSTFPPLQFDAFHQCQKIFQHILLWGFLKSLQDETHIHNTFYVKFHFHPQESLEAINEIQFILTF